MLRVTTSKNVLPIMIVILINIEIRKKTPQKTKQNKTTKTVVNIPNN